MYMFVYNRYLCHILLLFYYNIHTLQLSVVSLTIE